MRKLKWAILLTAPFVGASPNAVFALVPDLSSDPTAIVQAQVDAFNDGDADRFASFYADNIEMFDLGPNAKPTLSGRSALIARYKPMLLKYHPKATVITRTVSDSFVIDKETTEAGGRSSTGIAIYEIENSKIRRVWFTP